jgi:hypothetical protein
LTSQGCTTAWGKFVYRCHGCHSCHSCQAKGASSPMDVGGGAGWFHQELLLLEPGEEPLFVGCRTHSDALNGFKYWIVFNTPILSRKQRWLQHVSTTDIMFSQAEAHASAWVSFTGNRRNLVGSPRRGSGDLGAQWNIRIYPNSNVKLKKFKWARSIPYPCYPEGMLKGLDHARPSLMPWRKDA